jgi:hypothetical protein
MIRATLNPRGAGHGIDNGPTGWIHGHPAHRESEGLCPTQARIVSNIQAAVPIPGQEGGLGVPRVYGQYGSHRPPRPVASGIHLGPGQTTIGAAIDASQAGRPDNVWVGWGDPKIEHLRPRSTGYSHPEEVPGTSAVGAAFQAAVLQANEEELPIRRGTDEAHVPALGQGRVVRHAQQVRGYGETLRMNGGRTEPDRKEENEEDRDSRR